jgi:hypothetical protein
MQRGRSEVSLSDLIGAGLLRVGQEVTFRALPTTVAVVTESGGLRFKGSEYRSPSSAGRAASNGVATNGWVAWYVNFAGERESLATLRDRYTNGQK